MDTNWKKVAGGYVNEEGDFMSDAEAEALEVAAEDSEPLEEEAE